MFTSFRDLSVYVSVQESLWVSIPYEPLRIETQSKQNNGVAHSKRAHDQREAVPLAILISRVTTLAAAGSLVAAAAAAPLAVAGTGPMRAW